MRLHVNPRARDTVPALFGLNNRIGGLVQSQTGVLRSLQPKLCFDRGRLIESNFEFAEVEVGDDEFAVHEGRSLRLAAELYHLLHKDFVAAHFAGFEANVVCAEEAECLCAPWAARFDVKDRCVHCGGR